MLEHINIAPGAFLTSNFDLTHGLGTLTIVPAPLDIIPDDLTITCGEVPAFSYTAFGYQYADSAKTILTGGEVYNVTDTLGNPVTDSILPVGSYLIHISGVNQISPMNYTLVNDTGILVVNPAIITASCTATDLACNNDSSGTIDLTVTGGTAPYSYSWSNGATTEDLHGVPAGTYSVVVTDAFGCGSDSCSATINEPTLLEFSFNTVDATCYDGADGSASVTPIWRNCRHTQFSGAPVTQQLQASPVWAEEHIQLRSLTRMAVLLKTLLQ